MKKIAKEILQSLAGGIVGAALLVVGLGIAQAFDFTYFRDIAPEDDSMYTIGTPDNRYLSIYSDNASTTDGFATRFISTYATSTQATTSKMAITSLTDALIKAQADGSLIEAVAGTDYEVPLTFGDGLTRTSNDIDCDQANASTFGCIATTDYSEFKNKVASTSLSGASVITYNSGTGVITTTGGTFGSGNYTFPSNVLVSGSASTTNLGVSGNATFGTPTTTEAITLNADKRIAIYSDSLWTYASGHEADGIRFYNLNETAKSVIGFYDHNGAMVTALVSHDKLSAGVTHKHLSIETVDDSLDSLDTRFECTYGSAVGSDSSYCGVASGWNLNVGSGSNLKMIDGDLKHGSVLDIYPNADLGNTTIYVRFSTTSAGALNIGGGGTNDIQIDDSVTVTGSGLFQGTALGLDASGTGSVYMDRGNTSSFGNFILKTAGTDQWALGLRNDATNNFYIRDSINGVSVVTLYQGATPGFQVNASTTVTGDVKIVGNTNTTGNATNTNATSTNIAVTGTASTSKLFVSGQGGAGTQCLQVLANGQVTGTGGACGGASTALDDLTDVVITSATAGDVLAYNGSGWVNMSTSTYILASEIDTYAELDAIVADATLTHNGLIDTFSELDTIVADKTLANTNDAQTFSLLQTFTLGIQANASSTFQNITYVNATGSSATTTNLFATTASTTNLFTSNLAVRGFTVTVNGNVTLNDWFDQSVKTTSNPTFGNVVVSTIDTGHGANELFDMDQNVLTTSDVTFDNIVATGSSTLQNFTGINSTTTNATTTTLFATKASTTELRLATGNGCLQVTGGLVASTGSACSTTSITGSDTHVLFFDGANTPAGDAGMTYNKTLDKITVVAAQVTNGTTTNSTSTNISVSGTASTTALRISGTGYASTQCLQIDTTGLVSATGSECGSGGSKWTDDGALTYLTATADDVAFGGASTAVSPFWWDVSATTSYIGQEGPGDADIQFGAAGFEWIIGFDDTDDSFVIASSTALGTGNRFMLGKGNTASSTLIGSLTISRNSTTTNATTTNLFSTTASTTNLYASAFAFGSNQFTLSGTAFTGLGTWNLGDTSSFEITNSASCTVDAIGETCFDTTDNQIQIATSTNSSFPGVIRTKWELPVSRASTSMEYIDSLIPLPSLSDGFDVKGIQCYLVCTGACSLPVNLSDGTNDTNTSTCTATSRTSVATTTTSNNNFTANERWEIELGTKTGTIHRVFITIIGAWSDE